MSNPPHSDEFDGRRVTVAGLGRFGGGVAAARWLAGRGAAVTVTDRASAESLWESVAALDGVPIDFHLGGHDERDFTSADLVVASPAIPPHSPNLRAAASAGVPITTEIRLFVERCPTRQIVGVTGTKGKSTTTALLGRMLAAHAKQPASAKNEWHDAAQVGDDGKAVPPAPPGVFVGGNLGGSLLGRLGEMTAESIVVLEMSSFMLHHLGAIRWSPHVAVVTMVGTDHVEWHGSVEAYHAAKRNLVRFQTERDFAVVSASDKESRAFGTLTPGTVIPYGKRANLPEKIAPLLPGKHNRLNERAAFAAAKLFGVYPDEALAACADFPGLPHRLQLVHEAGGVRWYDDSIATVPAAAVAALESFDAGTVWQVVGGSDKGLDLTPMVDALRARARGVLCVGALGPSIASRVGPKAVDCGTIAEAVAEARRRAAEGDVVLLSPGCASYDQFAHFQERGEAFARLAWDA